MRRILRERDVEAAVKGGAVFAAGGGGWADHGRMLGTAAVNAGEPELVTMDEIAGRAWIATAAAIGAPAGTTQWQMLGVDYVKAVRACPTRARRTDLRSDDRAERQVEHAQRLAACRRSRHQGGRCGRRPARASDRRHGLDRARQFAGADDPIGGGRQPRKQRLYRACGARRDRARFRRSCGAPPTCRAASSRRAAIRSAPPTSSSTPRSAASRSRSRSARRSSPRSAKAAPRSSMRSARQTKGEPSSARARSRRRRCNIPARPSTSARCASGREQASSCCT